MPINYSDYPKNWKTKIRPDILFRANNRCEFCLVKNHSYAFRGTYNETEVYQTEWGEAFDADSGRKILDGSEGMHAYIKPISGNACQKAVRIVLTIMHLDHDITNNCYSNLAAGCQRCHNRYDAKNRAANRKAKKEANQNELFK